jgi:hypothetical protein
MARSRIVAFIIKELREVWPPVLFFFIAFNIVELTTQLMLAVYLARLANFMIATTTALIVGKAVLVANALPFLRRFDKAPLIWPILFKTVVYWAVVFVVRFLEQLVEYWLGDGTMGGIPEYMAEHFSWHRFAAIQIWIFVTFLIYTSLIELNRRLGDGELVKLFFTGHSSEPEPPGR